MNLNAGIKAVQTGLRIGGKFIVKNLPTILTALATIGVIDGVIRTAKKAPEAKEAFQKEKEKWEALPEDQKKEKAVYYWKLIKVGAKYYGVIVLEIAGVIVCMWSANRIDWKRMTAMGAGLKASNDYIKSLENEVKEDGGDSKLTKYKDNINNKQFQNGEIPDIPEGMKEPNHTIGETPIWDGPSRSWYISTVQNFQQAANKVAEDLYDQLMTNDWTTAFVPYCDYLAYGDLTPSGPSVSEDVINYLGFAVELPENCISPEDKKKECYNAVGVRFTSLIKDNMVGALATKYDHLPKYKYDYETENWGR